MDSRDGHSRINCLKIIIGVPMVTSIPSSNKKGIKDAKIVSYCTTVLIKYSCGRDKEEKETQAYF